MPKTNVMFTQFVDKVESRTVFLKPNTPVIVLEFINEDARSSVSFHFFDFEGMKAFVREITNASKILQASLKENNETSSVEGEA